MLRKRYTIYLLLFIMGRSSLLAQDNAAAIKPFLEKVQQAYTNASRLGFRIQYLYSNAGQPGKYIDSLTGEVQLDGSRSRFVVDGTETVVTDRYTINISPESRLIYLGPARRNTMADPAAMLDSLVARLDGVHVLRTTDEKSDWLTVEFPPGQPYVRMRMAIDPHTGYLQRVAYDLHTDGWLQQEQIDAPGHPAPYQREGHVEMIFSHYQKGLFDDALFNESNFFYKTGDRYIPAERYKEYNIFLASSKL